MRVELDLPGFAINGLEVTTTDSNGSGLLYRCSSRVSRVDDPDRTIGVQQFGWVPDELLDDPLIDPSRLTQDFMRDTIIDMLTHELDEHLSRVWHRADLDPHPDR